MKKIMLFAAACIALAACNKDIDTASSEIGDGSAFVKGQKVTLTVKTGDQTKVSSELVTSGEDKDKVNFKWETGDKIKVIVGESSAEFTLSSGAGTASATFTGTMPAGGNSFNVQYPVTDPDLSTQTYVADGLPKDKMKMTATGCTIDKPFSLTAQNAALRLNLYGLTSVGSIVVITNEGTPKTYTLDCNGSGSTGTEPSKTDKPKPFFIVVPAGTYGFTVSVKNASDTQLYSFSTTSGQDKTFVANEILSMKPLGYPCTDAQPIAITTGSPATTTVWAPVNCGYDSDHTYGLLYQWGRTDGSTYDAAWTSPSSHAAETQIQTAVTATWDVNGYNKGPKSNEFYKNSSEPYDWYTNDSSKQLGAWPITAPEGTSGIGNPCPEGWRVPTYNELNALYGENGSPEIVEFGGQNGCYFNGTSSASSGVFLPAAGDRDCDYGISIGRGGEGIYWSSAVNGNFARYLYFYSVNASMYDYSRASGYSVRCVQE